MDTVSRTRTRIRSVEPIPITLPLRRDWVWRGLGQPLGVWVLVRVETEDGLVGWGEATPLPDWGGDHGRYYGETVETVVGIIRDHLAGEVIGLDPLDLELALARMDIHVKGHVYAKAAIEIALQDIRGQIAGLPLYQLLGGAAHEGVVIAHMIGVMALHEAVDEARAAIAEGALAFQLKGTGEFDADIELVRQVRAAVGPEVLLRFDANQGYRDPKDAIRALEAFADAGVDLVEQPTEGLREMAEVRAGARLPIVADESCWSPRDAADIGRMRAADAISIYVAKAGGIANAQRVAAVAGAFGLRCDVNGSLESGVGNAANVHFAVATPAVTLAAVIPVTAPKGCGTSVVGRYYLDDVVSEPFRFEHGRLYAPTGPGLGVTVDEEKLHAFRSD